MKEERIQIMVSQYLRLQYPNVYFTMDFSGLKLPIGLATKAQKQRSTHKLLDLMIFEPRENYNALVLELKDGEDKVYTKKRDFRNTEHVIEQNKSIEHLKSKGYYCCYAFSFDHAKHLIDSYMILPTE
jgi:hypothetical protein